MARVYANANRTAGRHVNTRKAVRGERDQVTRAARNNLAGHHENTRITPEGYFPATITEDEESGKSGWSALTILNAPNALALEFGHAPSGYFAGTKTKSPVATYILTRAAIRGSVS